VTTIFGSNRERNHCNAKSKNEKYTGNSESKLETAFKHRCMITQSCLIQVCDRNHFKGKWNVLIWGF